MVKKLLWKGTLKEMREHPCYKYAKEEIETRIIKKLDKMENMIHGDSEWDNGFDDAIRAIRRCLNEKEKD